MKDKRQKLQRAAVLLVVLGVAMLAVACDELRSPTDPVDYPNNETWVEGGPCSTQPVKYRGQDCTVGPPGPGG